MDQDFSSVVLEDNKKLLRQQQQQRDNASKSSRNASRHVYKDHKAEDIRRQDAEVSDDEGQSSYQLHLASMLREKSGSPTGGCELNDSLDFNGSSSFNEDNGDHDDVRGGGESGGESGDVGGDGSRSDYNLRNYPAPTKAKENLQDRGKFVNHDASREISSRGDAQQTQCLDLGTSDSFEARMLESLRRQALEGRLGDSLLMFWVWDNFNVLMLIYIFTK